MMPRTPSRVEPCSPTQARTRLRHAERFLEVARLVGEEDVEAEYASAAAALAVLAGIAAADAACCKALGSRSRGQDHQQAADLVEQVIPGGKKAAQDLRKLLAMQDTAHYGLVDLGNKELKAALRQANSLFQFARHTVRG